MPSLPRLRRILECALIAAFAVFSLYVPARIALEPRDPARGVGVVFAPWTSADAALARAIDAGARFIRFGAFPFIVVVVPDEADYSRRVSAAGALLVVDPVALAACLAPFSGKQG